jgi:biotin transporter BioY
MMVGVITLPVETGFFGKKAAILRNSIAFIYSFIVAMVVGGLM